ncbi:hypothetical protein CBER1_05766 [Cercospora berteroae]|uniref:Uncharacterized protein n=1 Tax=Cercospora berteroae TaxID=357750 RepID=A0A2S6CI04_9PEZI|nr:hypothetical protein CBER1_05766 [Cercospora berteroae]
MNYTQARAATHSNRLQTSHILAAALQPHSSQDHTIAIPEALRALKQPSPAAAHFPQHQSSKWTPRQFIMANEGFWHGNGRKLPRPLLIAKDIPEEKFNPSLRALVKKCLPRPEPPSHTFRLTQSDQIELNRKRRAQGLPEFPILEVKGKVSTKVEARLRKTLQEVTSKANLWSKRLDCCESRKTTAAAPSFPPRPALNGRSISVVDTSAYVAQNVNDLQSRFGCALRRSNAFRRTGSTIRRSANIRRRLSAASRDEVRSLELLTPADRDFDPMQSIAEDGAEQTEDSGKASKDSSVVANVAGETRLPVRSFYLDWEQSRRARSRSDSSSTATSIELCDCLDAENTFSQQTHISRVPNYAVQVHRSASLRSQRALVVSSDSDDHLADPASADDSTRKRQYGEVDRVWWK